MTIHVGQLASWPVSHINSVNASKIEVLNTQISDIKLIKEGYHHLHKNYLHIKNKNKNINSLSIIKCITGLNKRNQALSE